MNNRYFDHIMHASSSARKILNALRSAGGDTKGFMADDLTNCVVVGIINASVKQAALSEELAAELPGYIFENASIRNREISPEKFDEAVTVIGQAFKTGNVRNDYQFFWNMIKEAMYCIETDVQEKHGVKLEASTISYHMSNMAKEAVGATGLKYASDQLVF